MTKPAKKKLTLEEAIVAAENEVPKTSRKETPDKHVRFKGVKTIRKDTPDKHTKPKRIRTNKKNSAKLNLTMDFLTLLRPTSSPLQQQAFVPEELPTIDKPDLAPPEPTVDLLSTYQTTLTLRPLETPIRNRTSSLKKATRALERLIPAEFTTTTKPFLGAATAYIGALKGQYLAQQRERAVEKEMTEHAIDRLKQEIEMTRSRYQTLRESNKAIYAAHGYHHHRPTSS